ncbi:hypothetical protein GCM10023090_18750 [Acidovorax lacteus]|uniref:Glycine zipper 2TM domain-containing protein n=1 Tax=Acidovorax lacteus TaxID=1924988 RepID=A0ABP8L8C0_9BURK
MQILPRSSLLVAPAYGAAAAPRWMWAALGALGASVVALAAALVLQGRDAPGTAAHSAASDVLAAAAPPVAAHPAAPVAHTAAQTGVAAPGQRAAAPSAPAAPSPRAATVAPAAGAWDGGTAVADRTARPVAPLCATCGRVESVQPVQQAAPATGVGAVAGGVLGAVVGNQIGKGGGRTAATVLGAVGGGYVGHQVEQRTRTQTAYRIAVRMDDGSLREFTRSQPYAVGAAVRVDAQGLRLAPEGRNGPAAEAYPAAQPGMVRVGQTPA